MNVQFEPYTPTEAEQLIAFLTSDTWTYFVNMHLTPELVREWIDAGEYDGDGNRVFWIVGHGQRVGLVRLHDLDDGDPLVDVRIHRQYHGQGIGKHAIRWATEYIFTTLPEVIRFEGQTRQDNIAMRKVFRACGFVKEAHYRKAWPGADGRRYDGIGYVILREDWERGSITPVNWDDEPD